MGIISMNSTRLSSVARHNIRPDMRFYNESGFEMIMYECALFEQEIFNLMIPCDYAELSYYTDKNALNESVMLTVCNEGVEEGIKKIGAFIIRIKNAIVAAFKRIKEFIMEKVRAIKAKFAKNKEKADDKKAPAGPLGPAGLIGMKPTTKKATYIIVKNDALIDRFYYIGTIFKQLTDEELKTMKDEIVDGADLSDVGFDKTSKDIENTSHGMKNNSVEMFTTQFTGGKEVSNLKKFIFDEMFEVKTSTDFNTETFNKVISSIEALVGTLSKVESRVLSDIDETNKNALSVLNSYKNIEEKPASSVMIYLYNQLASGFVSAISMIIGRTSSVINGVISFNARTAAQVAVGKEEAGAEDDDNKISSIYEAYGSGSSFIDNYDTIVDNDDQLGKLQKPVIDPTRNNRSGGDEEIEISGRRSGYLSNGEYEDEYDDDDDLEEAYAYFDSI